MVTLSGSGFVESENSFKEAGLDHSGPFNFILKEKAAEGKRGNLGKNPFDLTFLALKFKIFSFKVRAAPFTTKFKHLGS